MSLRMYIQNFHILKTIVYTKFMNNKRPGRRTATRSHYLKQIATKKELTNSIVTYENNTVLVLAIDRC